MIPNFISLGHKWIFFHFDAEFFPLKINFAMSKLATMHEITYVLKREKIARLSVPSLIRRCCCFLKVTLILKKSIIVFFGTLRVISSESSLDFPLNPNNLLVTSYNRKFIELLNHNARTYLYAFVKTIKLIEDLFLFTFLHEWLRAVGLLFA